MSEASAVGVKRYLPTTLRIYSLYIPLPCTDPKPPVTLLLTYSVTPSPWKNSSKNSGTYALL